jgi:hypothetical protein
MVSRKSQYLLLFIIECHAGQPSPCNAVHGSVITIVGLSVFIAIINVSSLMLLAVAHMCATVGLVSPSSVVCPGNFGSSKHI